MNARGLPVDLVARADAIKLMVVWSESKRSWRIVSKVCISGREIKTLFDGLLGDADGYLAIEGLRSVDQVEQCVRRFEQGYVPEDADASVIPRVQRRRP